MDTWQQYTLRAQTEFQLACYGNAILMHNQALDHARHAYQQEPACCLEHALSRVLISHFNLADCYVALGDAARAAECYLTAQRFLLQVQRTRVGSADDMNAVLHGFGHLHQLWCALLREHPVALSYEQRATWHESSKLLLGSADALAVRH